jgi:hypothetical protein
MQKGNKTYGKKSDGSEDGAVVGRGETGVELADGAGLVLLRAFGCHCVYVMCECVLLCYVGV